MTTFNIHNLPQVDILFDNPLLCDLFDALNFCFLLKLNQIYFVNSSYTFSGGIWSQDAELYD